ncbi:TPA: DNA-binding protein [Yersinia enterocolitica]|nr:DNA-binding protein [Yersinia enterocolitica]
MRDYGKVSPQFWIGKTGKDLKRSGFEAQIVSLYLLTSPHANMIGLYYMPLMYMAHETGLGLEGASKGLASAIKCGFCLYDNDSEMVWVPEMAAHQIGTSLKPTDKRCPGVQNTYDAQPDNPFLPMFYDKYASDFNLTSRRDFTTESVRGLEGASKGLASQEQEQEQEKEQDQTTLSERNRTEGEKESDKSPAQETDEKKPDPVDLAFEGIFWIAGLRKDAKVKARSAFKTKYREHKTKTGETPEQFATLLADDIRGRVESGVLGTDKLLPTSYLSGERWNDENPAPQPVNNKTNSPAVFQGPSGMYVDFDKMGG